MKNIDFQANAFIDAIKSVTKNVPFTEKNNQAKRIVADAISNSGISKKDFFNYIWTICPIPSDLSDKEWNNIINYHINWKGSLGKLLQVLKSKNKTITKDQFSVIAESCGYDSEELLLENKIDQFGWLKVLNALKSEINDIEEENKTEDCKICPKEEIKEIPVPCEPAPVISMRKTKTIRSIVMKDEMEIVVAEFKKSKDASSETGICECSIRKSLNNYPGYQHLKGRDGKCYSFEYVNKEVEIPEPVKAHTRKYTKNKIVIINIKTEEVSVYENAIMAANELGVKKDEIYYRTKAANHKLNETFEVWTMEDYGAKALNMEVYCAKSRIAAA